MCTPARVVIVRPLETRVFSFHPLRGSPEWAALQIREFELQLKCSSDAVGCPVSTSKAHYHRSYPHQTTPNTSLIIGETWSLKLDKRPTRGCVFSPTIGGSTRIGFTPEVQTNRFFFRGT